MDSKSKVRPRLIRNALHVLVKRFGNAAMKQKVWDDEFNEGKWAYLNTTESGGGDRDIIYKYIEMYSRNGAILDLGCGYGNTGLELASGSYSRYVGVDLSDVAIAKGQQQTASKGRSDTNFLKVGEILTYSPEEKFDLILFRESINYISLFKVPAMLERYRAFLKPGGAFVVRVCNRRRYSRILDTIRERFDQVDAYVPEEENLAILVFS